MPWPGWLSRGWRHLNVNGGMSLAVNNGSSMHMAKCQCGPACAASAWHQAQPANGNVQCIWLAHQPGVMQCICAINVSMA